MHPQPNYHIRLIATPGFYFSKWVFGWGSIQKMPQKVDFLTKKWGFIQENPQKLDFSHYLGLYSRVGQHYCRCGITKVQLFCLTGHPVSLVLLRSKDNSDFLQELFGNVLGISHFRLQKSLKTYCRCKYLKILKKSAYFLFAISGTCNNISIMCMFTYLQ